MNKDATVIPSEIPPPKTIRLEISANTVNTASGQRVLHHAAEILRSGGTVAMPTETVYGLAANALDAASVAAIFAAKQRPAWDPLIVHVCDTSMLSTVAAEIPARARRLIEKFWPGPLTLLLPKSDAVPPIVTAGRPLVGVRMPAHSVARALIVAAGVPLAAPSANRFGHTSPTTAQHVLDDLEGRIDMVLDAGSTQCGVESTVVEIRGTETIVYRPGALSMEEIESVAGPVVLHRPEASSTGDPQVSPESLPSPGVGIRHYAPKAQMVPIELGCTGQRDLQKDWLNAVRNHCGSGTRVGVMLPRQWPLPDNFTGLRYEWGNWNDDGELARRFFSGLRDLDAMGAETILCPLPAAVGLGTALRDRILKAARAK